MVQATTRLRPKPAASFAKSNIAIAFSQDLFWTHILKKIVNAEIVPVVDGVERKEPRELSLAP